MGKYAEGTSVPIDRSRAEVEKILTRYGADQMSSGWTGKKAVIMFRMRARYVRIEMPLLAIEPGQTLETKETAARENRRRWRAMVLYLKAMLESVESEIVSFETAFMSHIVLPDRRTVAEFVRPQIEAAYQSGKMPKELPGW